MIAETVNTLAITLEILIKGIIIGIAVSAPMGPIGVLCIQKTINRGRRVGMISGLGAAAADSLYAVIAAFGLGYTQRFFTDNQTIMQAVGIIILLFLGCKMFFTSPVTQIRKRHTPKKVSGLFGDLVSVFFLTLSNPLTIIFFGASIAALDVFSDTHSLASQVLTVAGVFAGASIWWFSLTGIVNLFRHKFRLKQLWWINKISGAVIIVLTSIAAVGLTTGVIK